MTLETRHDLPDQPHKTDEASDTDNQDLRMNKYLDDQDNRGANETSEKASGDQEIGTSGNVAVVSYGRNESDWFIKKEEIATTKGGPTQSLLKRLKTDLPFRRRYMHTLCVCWGFIVLVRNLINFLGLHCFGKESHKFSGASLFW